MNKTVIKRILGISASLLLLPLIFAFIRSDNYTIMDGFILGLIVDLILACLIAVISFIFWCFDIL